MCSLFCQPRHSPKKIKHEESNQHITIDGVHVFNVERIDCGFGAVDCHYDVYDLAGKKVIRINVRDFNSPVEVSKSNPDGRVVYYEFIFLESKQKAEMEFAGAKEERVAKIIYQNKLITEGQLNVSAVDEFVLTHGTPFNDRVKY